MHAHQRFLSTKGVLITILLTITMGCTSLTSVSDQPGFSEHPAQTVRQHVRIEDRVVLTTKNNQSYSFKVSDITSEALRGIGCQDCASTSINFSDIESLATKRINTAKTVGGVVLGVVVIAIAVGGGGFAPGL